MADPDIVPLMRDPAGGGSAPRIPPGIILGVIAFGVIAFGVGTAFATPGISSGFSRGDPPDLPAAAQPSGLPEGKVAGEPGGNSGADAGDAGTGTVVLTGVRASRGGAVDCPQLRDDAGVLHPVSYLPPRIAPGDRVTVRGTLAVTTTCRGVVLVVDELVEGAPSNGAPGGG